MLDAIVRLMAYKMISPLKCRLCDRPAYARLLCASHYVIEHRNGNIKKYEKLSVHDVWESRIEKTESCWLWRGQIGTYGYGYISLNGKPTLAHRFVYEQLVGPIPQGLYLLHSCDTPACVNPDHLRCGTQKENIQDAVDRGRIEKGEDRYNAKLTETDIRAIRADGRPKAHIARDYGVTRALIRGIQAGRRWKHVT